MEKYIYIFCFILVVFVNSIVLGDPNFQRPIELVTEELGKVLLFEDTRDIDKIEKYKKERFWYLPSELYVQRRRFGSLSRLSISLEDYLLHDTEQPESALLRLQLDPALPEAKSILIRQALAQRGYGKFNPFEPDGQWKMLQLSTITSLKVLAFELQLDFLGSLQQDRVKIPSFIDMTHPIPLSIVIPNQNAGVLARILQERKTLTIGTLKVQCHDRQISVPVIINLDLPKIPTPFEFLCKYYQSGVALEIKNRTEHNINLKALFFTSGRYKGKKQRYFDIHLSGHAEDNKEPESYFIPLSDLDTPEQFQLIKFDYSISPNWPLSINWVLRHHYIPLEYEVVASIDRVGVSTQKIQNVNVDIRILDENDAVHDYFITFEDFKNRITKRKIQISQQIIFKKIYYKVLIITKKGRKLITPVLELEEGKFGQNKAILPLTNIIAPLMETI
ncbi:MAG: hypothetical protein HUU50_02785 [Candidatus Brocadiae bacterium]|nr:hypothetical protein [Candidatus Brocadiia bacterium]